MKLAELEEPANHSLSLIMVSPIGKEYLPHCFVTSNLCIPLATVCLRKVLIAKTTCSYVAGTSIGVVGLVTAGGEGGRSDHIKRVKSSTL